MLDGLTDTPLAEGQLERPQYLPLDLSWIAPLVGSAESLVSC